MKTEFFPLKRYPKDTIYRGAILRFPAKPPYEKIVEFLVYEHSNKNFGLGLMVASGYKAGLTAKLLPKESLSADKMGIDVKWLVTNWTNWVYAGASPDEVLVANERCAE
jgi:hypothetical protein